MQVNRFCCGLWRCHGHCMTSTLPGRFVSRTGFVLRDVRIFLIRLRRELEGQA
jgi:hypothetical protein